ncbi:MAG: hypothetical protein AAF747_07790 [Planctomycetota bacterium]
MAVLAGLGYLAVAQVPIPGSLEPPPGPVEDTTPSLAEIQRTVEAVAVLAEYSRRPNLFVSRTLNATPGGSEVFVPGTGAVRLRSVIITEGVVDIADGVGNNILGLAANSARPDLAFTEGFAQYDLDVELVLPISVRQRTSRPPVVTLLYQIND